MSQLLVGMLLLVIAMRLWEAHTQKHSCAYCGEYKGHEPHCPMERFENH